MYPEFFNCPYECPFNNNDDFYRMQPPPPPPMGGMGGGQSAAPSGPPPSFTPSKNEMQKQGGPSLKAVEPGAIKPCKYRYIYIWPENGRGFWAYLTFVGRQSVSGYRWNGRRWVYFGMDMRRIDSFQCY